MPTCAVWCDFQNYPECAPPYKLFVDYFKGKPETVGRLKIMAQVVNWDAIKLPSLLKR